VTKASDNVFPKVTFVEGAAPASPSASDFHLYFDSSDHLLKWKNSAGTVFPVTTGGFSDPMTTRGDVIVRNASNVTARLAVGSANTYLGSDGTDPSWSAVTDAKLSTSDIATNDASTSKHGFLKKLDNTATHYMDGTGAWSTPPGGGALILLSSQVLGSPAADMTETAISGSYKDLVIVMRLRSTDSGVGIGSSIRVGNGSIDTGSNYAYHQAYTGWTGGSNSSTSATSASLAIIPNSGATAGSFGEVQLEILNYASTTQMKVWVGLGFSQDGSGVMLDTIGGLWKTTGSAIDQFRVTPSAGNLDTGSAVIIYGRG